MSLGLRSPLSLKGTRFVLDDDRDEVRFGLADTPIVPLADTIVGGEDESPEPPIRSVRLFVGLRRSVQQQVRGEWAWRYEWSRFDRAAAIAVMAETAGPGWQVAVIEITVTASGWRAPGLLNQEAVVLQAMDGAAVPFAGMCFASDLATVPALSGPPSCRATRCSAVH